MHLASSNYDCVFIGGGAGGFFGAISCAEHAQTPLSIAILEGTSRPLTKVRISGGGRCNVTHNCFEPRELVKNYPRGRKELLGALHKFGPAEMLEWLRGNGVEVKAEADGRMFPTTDNSQTIIDCLVGRAQKLGVELLKGQLVKSIVKTDSGFKIQTNKGEFQAKKILLATGSMPQGHALARSLGHSITRLIPSLFTFEVADAFIKELSGVSLDRVHLKLMFGKKKYEQAGPLLFTHWGLSGPAVLKLSAFAATEMLDCDYRTQMLINWIPEVDDSEVDQWFQSCKKNHGRKQILNHNPSQLPKRLWQALIEEGELGAKTWAEASKVHLQTLKDSLLRYQCSISGKGEFKDEFVTCGGVPLNEIDCRHFGSKMTPGLFFAGEVLNIDGITGGFNFQNAWTTSRLAGKQMSATD